MCDLHGGAAPQVRRGAAERLIMTADQVAQLLVKMMEDTEVPFGVRAKIAQDLLDRASLIATQVHLIVPTTEDPIMRFFEGRSASRATVRPARRQRSRARRQAAVIVMTSSLRRAHLGVRATRFQPV